MYMKSFPADIVLDGPMHLRGYVDCEKCYKLMGVERALTHERYVWHNGHASPSWAPEPEPKAVAPFHRRS